MSLNPRKDLKPLLAVTKKSRKYAWLKEYDAIALQQAVINLNPAFDNFFNPKLRSKFPTFKRKQGRQSSYHCVGVKVLEGSLKSPKLSPIEACSGQLIPDSKLERASAFAGGTPSLN